MRVRGAGGEGGSNSSYGLLKIIPPEAGLGTIAPNGKLVAHFTLDGPRYGQSRLKITAKSGALQAESVLRIAPQVVVRSWGPTSPVFLVGEPITVECELANTGAAIALRPKAILKSEGKRIETGADRLAPGRTVVLKADLPPAVAYPESVVLIGAEWRADDAAIHYEDRVPDRDEAVFPGVEWLVGNERSSDSADIAESHPDRIRTIVHPNWVTIPAIGIHGRNGTVGLLWDVHQKWDGTHDRPGVHLRSPRASNQPMPHDAALPAEPA